MSKQFVVIGLGSTGSVLVKQLSSLGHSVFAIDKEPEVVQDITPFAARAAVADSLRQKMLESFPLSRADFVVVCIGSLENSLITVLNLKNMGIANIIAKASDNTHFAILEKMGLNPEYIFQPARDMAIELASKLDKLGRPNILDFMPLMDGHSVMEWKCPKNLIGKTLMEANLINKYGVQVIAIKDAKTGKLNAVPKAQYEFHDGDILFLFGPNNALDKID
ncbi:MAG: TrkA family potassium uptake protein [Fibromonadaceae bacterium]|jgi:trk system potassium uptake protein TrkA|nr:TrkA family potassium uptake protein [Fibromonadaceae bacterium]